MTAAMDPKFSANPYVGKPDRRGIPEFCGRCHANAAYMKRFNPAARVDQLAEYWTSRHGQRLREGDDNVAVCIDCHSVHDIRRKGNPNAPVYPTHVAETCGRCHSDAKRMASYHDASGQPLPVDQYVRWRTSVHAAALLEKGDLTAPTCNDCHGNHGATPPGVESVSFICGQCHAREAELFRMSAKAEGWNRHNELMANAEGCGTCHDDERSAVHLKHFSECITCHSNHGVQRPTVAMLGGLPDTPCAFCHEGVGPLTAFVAEPRAKAEHYRQVRATLLRATAAQHLSGNARFDWLVDQALQLPTHRQIAPGVTPRLRPEFARLFEKFRIGKTHYAYRDPATGRAKAIAVTKCGDCHRASGLPGSDSARLLLSDTRGLTSMIARSERILLAAQRGGVEVRSVRAELDSAIDSQIELEALVHTFSASGSFAEKRNEGLQHAHAALEAGQRALAELAFRRRWLFGALAVIFVTLTALALKIRSLP